VRTAKKISRSIWVVAASLLLTPGRQEEEIEDASLDEFHSPLPQLPADSLCSWTWSEANFEHLEKILQNEKS
jgi:hypothetical protein